MTLTELIETASREFPGSSIGVDNDDYLLIYIPAKIAGDPDTDLIWEE